jgi:hypothetical protein
MTQSNKSYWHDIIRPIITGPLVCIAFFKILGDLGMSVPNALPYYLALFLLIVNIAKMVMERREARAEL